MKTPSVIFVLMGSAITQMQSAPLVPYQRESHSTQTSLKTVKPPAPVVSTPATADDQFNLARRYLKGDDITKDEKKAFELMTSAAQQGHVEAQGGLGYFYGSGIVVQKDEAMAREWMRKGAVMGSAKAQLNLGLLLLNETESSSVKSEGIQWIKESAHQGLVEAISTQGSILLFGLYDQPVDYNQAYDYLANAAKQGHPDSQHLLGMMFEKGLGRPASPAEAETWFRKAAIQAHPTAQGDLARLLDPSNKEIARRVEALTWLVSAAGLNDASSKKILTEIYFKITPAEMALATKRAQQITSAHSSNLEK